MNRRERCTLLAIVVLGALLRVAHVWTVRDAPFLSMLYIDPLMYDEWGLRIASGRLFSERPFFLDPFYPYFLGLIYAVFGHHYLAVIAVQSLLGATVPLLVFFPTRRWFDLPTATVAAAIAAIYIPAIYFGGLIMKPGLALFLVAVWIGLMSSGLARPRRWPFWCFGGVVLGIACLVRGNLLLVTPVLALWLLLREGPKMPVRARWIETLALGAGLTAVLSLPALHNYAVGGEFILTTANAGANFFIGNNPDNETGEYQQLPFIRANPKYEQQDFAREARRRTGLASMTDREVSAFWFQESWSWLKGQPHLWGRLLWTKLRAFWGSYEIPDSLDYYLYREYAPVLRLPVPGFGLLSPLALLGAGLAWRRPGWPRLLLLLVGGYCLTVVAFFVFSRFRMVVAPALYVFAAHGLVELVRRARDAIRVGAGSRRPAVVAGASFVVLFLLVNVPVRARTDSLGFRIASTLGVPRVPERSFQGHYNLGLAYAGRAKTAEAAADERRWMAEAERELRLAIELHGQRTETAKIHVELGKVLARQRRNRDAIEMYETAATIEPGDFQIHHALGILHHREGDRENAARAFFRALELAPRHATSAVRLGETLLELGRTDEAARAFGHALQIAPNNRRARQGLEQTRAAGGGFGAP